MNGLCERCNSVLDSAGKCWNGYCPGKASVHPPGGSAVDPIFRRAVDLVWNGNRMTCGQVLDQLEAEFGESEVHRLRNYLLGN